MEGMEHLFNILSTFVIAKIPWWIQWLLLQQRWVLYIQYNCLQGEIYDANRAAPWSSN